MRISKENIHENKIKCKNTLQITLDDDFNVPDSKPDIDAIVKERGSVHIDSVKAAGDRAELSGNLDFALLYVGGRESDGRHLPVKMDGKMNISEAVNLAENCDDTYVTCNASIDDITVKAINSRKISVKAIVTLEIICEQIEDVSIGCELEDMDENDKLQILTRDIDYAQLAVNVRDNLRIKENIELGAGKPDVAELLWSDVDIHSMNTRLLDDALSVSGELSIFIMYLGQDESQSVQWYETSAAFDGTLDVSGCNADMTSYVQYNIVSCNLEVKPDYDGENREISVEITADMSVQAYEEQEKKILADIYSPIKDVSINDNQVTLKKLLVHNNSKCRGNARIKAGDYVNLLQICNCTGTAQVDDVTIEEDGLLVDGAIMANVFYVTSDDNAPMGSIRTAVPFSQKIIIDNKLDNRERLLSMKGIKDEGQEEGPKLDYSINVSVEQLSAVMTGSNEIEVKGVVSLDTLCFAPYKVRAIMDCDTMPYEESEFLRFPSIIGYIANGEETIWDIARKNHTTPASIRSRNASAAEHASDETKFKRGDKLLLVKAAR